VVYRGDKANKRGRIERFISLFGSANNSTNLLNDTRLSLKLLVRGRRRGWKDRQIFIGGLGVDENIGFWFIWLFLPFLSHRWRRLGHTGSAGKPSEKGVLGAVCRTTRRIDISG
jgi:hypothetical protein